MAEALLRVFSYSQEGQTGKGKRPLITRHTLSQEHKQRVRLLLAEDNPTNQKVAVHILRKFGFSIDAVGDGREALDAVRRIPYDLILMDIQMPEMDGYEATRAIRALNGNHLHVPIIALTANALQGDREKCLAAGMDDYLAKPIDPHGLIAKIQEWIDKKTSK
jgi:CheY-like chemotaxis protein